VLSLGAGEAMADLYQILRVAVDATPQEIKQAYDRLIKECRYNAQLNRQDIERAYRVLTNPTQKKQYDSRLELTTKADTIRTKKIKKAKAPRIKPLLPQLTLLQKSLIALGLFVAALLFYSLRFGYLLKEFSEGDILYNKVTSERVGRIIKVQPNHDFGSKRADAYLIEIREGEQQWIPQDIIKSYCDEPK
jgi:curved DNA-binding protein CbpA